MTDTTRAAHARKWQENGYDMTDAQVFRWAEYAAALLASTEAQPPTEPVAYAIYGRVTGNLKYVEILDEHEIAERAEYYDVVPLFAAAHRTQEGHE